MYGDRGRIGLIVPASNTVCEKQMATHTALGAKRIAVATPYTLEIDELEKGLMEESGMPFGPWGSKIQ